jgi:pyruvate-ferredoxin/flavodoxin oxidoreductase
VAEVSRVTIDGNEAAARVAFSASEVIVTYPIAPAAPMGELADAWSVAGRRNLWGGSPKVVQMQSEGGVAGALHGAVQAGSLATSFTASQGLLLMVPDMYRIAGGHWPCVLHVAARSVASHASSIYGDHSDVMAVRQTGWALLSAGSVQEAHDFAIVAHAATLAAGVPFVHFFDGFRTSHEIATISPIPDASLAAMVDRRLVQAHRGRALSPERPVVRGAAQGEDVFFSSREAANGRYAAAPGIVQSVMDRLAAETGRAYRLFEYVGHPEAEQALVLMGSAAGAAEEAVATLLERGAKVGLVKVRLYRPWDAAAFLKALPRSVQRLRVLDRTKEPGAPGEPLYLDVLAALAASGRRVQVDGGRYGLASREFTPAMAAAVLMADSVGLRSSERCGFTVGIQDDVTGLSLPWDPQAVVEPADVLRVVSYSCGADGCVAADRLTLELIGEHSPLYAQGYVEYDSRKTQPIVVSHLRFSPRPIRTSCRIERAGFVIVSHDSLLSCRDVLSVAEPGATLLLNTAHSPGKVWDCLPSAVRAAIASKRLRFCIVDANRVSMQVGTGEHIGTIMQMCFFWLSGILPHAQAVERLKHAIQQAFSKRGRSVVEQHLAAADKALDNFHEVKLPESPAASGAACDGQSAECAGNRCGPPVSALPSDGTLVSSRSVREVRPPVRAIPIWDPSVCTECGYCSMACAHAAIRIKVFDAGELANAPDGFASRACTTSGFEGRRLTVQILPDDCTACGVCVDVCPARNKTVVKLRALNMSPASEHADLERVRATFFLQLPEIERSQLPLHTELGSQLARPLFQHSGACAGCGETPYLKLLSQLFGDRAVIANATGCSSLYGAPWPTTPWSVDAAGRGPAWAHSLLEDNAEFGCGMRLAIDQQRQHAIRLLKELSEKLDEEQVEGLIEAEQADESQIALQRQRVARLKESLSRLDADESRELDALADLLVRRSVWIVGGDGWANDIGFGGLDHVLASGLDVNVLVLDTGLYSSTGGQVSSATPRAAVAKFAATGQHKRRKDLGRLAMAGRGAFVAQIAMGADYAQAIRAFHEADSYTGPSLILAYSHCVAHGLNMATAMTHQRQVVQCGMWPLYRYDPRREAGGGAPLEWDSAEPKLPFRAFAMTEARFAMLARTNPDQAKQLFDQAQQDINEARRGT